MKYIKYIILGIICFSIGYYSAPKIFGARTMNPIWNRADLEVEVSVGDFEDATTTPIAIQNPFSATSSTKTYIVNNVNAGTNSQETISLDGLNNN